MKGIAPIDDEPVLAAALRVITRALQLLLAGLVLYAATEGLGLVFNTGVPLVIAALPLAVRYRYGYRMNAVLALLIAVGATFHALGAFGLYQSIGWFDTVAHGVAGALVGGTGYALVQVVDTQFDDVVIPGRLRFVFILVFAMAVGVAWELAEFSSELIATQLGGEPVLSQYGLDDTAIDLASDLVGAVVVGLWGTTYFDDLRVVLDEYVGSGPAEGEPDPRPRSGPE